jgi:hypothetical protein
MSNSRRVRPGTRSDKWKPPRYDADGQRESPDGAATTPRALNSPARGVARDCGVTMIRLDKPTEAPVSKTPAPEAKP